MTTSTTDEHDQLAGLVEKAFKEARKEGLSIGDAANIVANLIREHLDERMQENAAADAGMINVQSIFGVKSGLPQVDFRYGFEHFTLTVEQAREHALDILQCAEAASQDAGIYRWLTLSELGLNPRAAATAIGDLRRFRGDVPKEDWRTPAQQLADNKAN